VFLDVRMPGLGGLELARVLRRFERPPAVVFVSAFDDAAVHAFEVAAVDYLVKPVSRVRLDEAIERAAQRSAPEEPAGDETLAVDALRGGGTRLLPRSSVLYLQAHGDYVRVASSEGRFLVRARLSDLEERWAGHGFARVHRGFVVNLRRAVEVRPRLNGTAVLVMADGAEVPIARRQVGELRRKLGV
jgi:DNA-binding LytR/AlgR family response regulator